MWRNNVYNLWWFVTFYKLFWQNQCFLAIYVVLSRNQFWYDLRAFAWRKIEPKIVPVEKEWQIWGMQIIWVNIWIYSYQKDDISYMNMIWYEYISKYDKNEGLRNVVSCPNSILCLVKSRPPVTRQEMPELKPPTEFETKFIFMFLNIYPVAWTRTSH